MKYLTFILFFLLFTKSYTQNSELISNSWYLQNIIIDGEDNFPPETTEFEDIIAEFAESGFFTFVCGILYGPIEYYNGAFAFNIPLDQTPEICDIPENFQYEVLYFGFYKNPGINPFNYSITLDSNGTKILIVTSVTGDQAIYYNQILSNENYDSPTFLIYPNPVNNELFIIDSKNELANVKIYSITGKLLKVQKIIPQEQNAVNVSSLPKGIYFINIESNQGAFKAERFIKD